MMAIHFKQYQIFRMFKLTRHFEASQALGKTAAKAWRQILGMIALLILLVVIFAIMLYEVEGGSVCFVGDPNCIDGSGLVSSMNLGTRVKINKIGELSSFSNMFYSLWFSLVTLTTTGTSTLSERKKTVFL